MTTYPAEALLGRFSLLRAVEAVGSSLLFALVARVVWSGSIARYTSASS
jgi:ABC-2 type transport system permease protein